MGGDLWADDLHCLHWMIFPGVSVGSFPPSTPKGPDTGVGWD